MMMTSCHAPQQVFCSTFTHTISDLGVRRSHMVVVTAFVMALVALVFGVLVLVFPKLLRWIVGVYFIIWGVLELLRALV